MERRKDRKKRVLKEGEYERANGTFEYRWRDRTGRRRSVYAKTLEELRTKEREIARDILNGKPPNYTKLTVNDLYNLWLKQKRGLRPTTLSTYKKIYSIYVEKSFGNYPIKNLVKNDVKTFYKNLIEEAGLSVGTVLLVDAILHQVFGLGVENGFLAINPSSGATRNLKKELALAEENEDTHRALTLQEQQLFEEYLARPGPHARWRGFFTFMLWTGLRCGEAAGLRWCDVDLKNNTISVNHTLVYYQSAPGVTPTFSIHPPKTSAGKRTIPLLPQAKEALLLERQYQEEHGYKCGVTIDGYTDFIFVTWEGNVRKNRDINIGLKRIIKQCNHDIASKVTDGKPALLLPDFRTHALRHTFATRLYETGVVSTKSIQAVLGHENEDITLNVYVNITDAQVKEELNRFGKLYEK